jgi:hypothetical protein
MSTSEHPIDPGRDAIMRSVCPSWSDNCRDDRSVENKAMMVAKEVSYRLGGLSSIAYGLCFAETAKGGRQGESALHSELHYFATALKDAANQLKVARQVWWDEVKAADERAVAKRPPRRKGTKRRSEA